MLLIAGIVWFAFYRPTPKQQFLHEIAKIVKAVNKGDYSSVRDKFSPEFVAFLGQQALEPQQILFAIRELDQNQGASYSFHRLTLYEEGQFAEVEFIRKVSGEEQSFLLPFVWREDKWWITDHFKSDHTWDTIQGM